jgi:hypothetical protein
LFCHHEYSCTEADSCGFRIKLFMHRIPLRPRQNLFIISEQLNPFGI